MFEGWVDEVRDCAIGDLAVQAIDVPEESVWS